MGDWLKLYFICIIYDKYTNNTECDYNTTTIQMGFRGKSNDLFESVSQEIKGKTSLKVLI